MSQARYLFAAWKTIRRQAQRADRLALFTDFDGTLVPIRSRADDVRLPVRIRKLLNEIARSGATVGVISGRSLDDVQSRVGVSRIWYVGAHGFFLRDPGNRTIALLSPKDRARMVRVWRELAPRLVAVPGIRLENKVSSVAVHYRGTPRKSIEVARAALAQALDKIQDLHLMAGKKVWEILPGPRTDKWMAIQFILGRERKERVRGRWLVFYLGDDTTDERVFKKMSGISIAVGKRQHTAAQFFLHSPAEVRQFLERWSEVAQ